MAIDPETQKLIDAAIAKTRDEMKALFDEAIVPLKANNANLLAEKKALHEKNKILEGKPPTVEKTPEQIENDRWSKLADRVLASKFHDATGPVMIERSQARDPIKYAEAKNLAAERGVEVKIFEDVDAVVSPVVTAHQFDFEEQTYVSSARVASLGGIMRSRQHLPEGVVTFKDDSQLTDGALEAAKLAAASGGE